MKKLLLLLAICFSFECMAEEITVKGGSTVFKFGPIDKKIIEQQRQTSSYVCIDYTSRQKRTVTGELVMTVCGYCSGTGMERCDAYVATYGTDYYFVPMLNVMDNSALEKFNEALAQGNTDTAVSLATGPTGWAQTETYIPTFSSRTAFENCVKGRKLLIGGVTTSLISGCVMTVGSATVQDADALKTLTTAGAIGSVLGAVIGLLGLYEWDCWEYEGGTIVYKF